MSLRLAWCSHAAAKHAVENYHYSKQMPVGKLARVGVWEDEKFIGVVLFGLGASRHLLTKYGLQQFQGCELLRIALSKHKAPVSQIVSIAIRMLRANYPKLQMIVSFADPQEGHVGGIYQAGNWIYAGTTAKSVAILHGGKVRHNRSFGSRFGKESTIKRSSLQKITKPGKHRYLMPLNDEMKKRLEVFRKPFPKKCDRSSG